MSAVITLLVLGGIGLFVFGIGRALWDNAHDDAWSRVHGPDRDDGWTWQPYDPDDPGGDGRWVPPPGQAVPEQTVARDTTGAIKGQMRGLNPRAEGPDGKHPPYGWPGRSGDTD